MIYFVYKVGGITLKSDFKLLTNNPMVGEKYSMDWDTAFVDGQYIDVLKYARDLIHTGYKLITHPLMGSIKPNETPYRSIIVKAGTALDVESLTIIESSIAATLKFQGDNKPPKWNESILEDFRFIDLKLMESAIDSIK